MTIKIFNTLSGEKEEFKPRHEGKVNIYTCGPTTYNFIHLGNARPIVFFDVVRRYFKYRGYDVRYVQNFTDVDDKIIKKAHEEKMQPLDLSAKYIQEYFKDADILGVGRADIHPTVSGHIGEIIVMIEAIINNGHGYVVDGDVYFDVKSFPTYGKLSKRTLEDLLAGARVEVDTRKKDAVDFALWKKAKPGEPQWDSPWGKGRPGWHIECSAMSSKYLEVGFDIHGGGQDLIFPHHENEIAQAEAATQCVPFVHYWMHNGFITINQEKMSKSLGNFFLVREILEKFSADVVRFYLISTHYRSPLDFDDEKLQMNAKALERIKNTVRLLDESIQKEIVASADDEKRDVFKAATIDARKKFEDAMNDDFNTALAIASVFDFCKEINIFINREDFALDNESKILLQQAQRLIFDIDEVLGLLIGQKTSTVDSGLTEELVDLIIELRQQAREKKDWKTSDVIRDRLKDIGIILEDTPQGVRWKKG